MLSLIDRDGHAVSGLHFSGTIGRPATDREDLSANFNEAESGNDAAMVRLAPGNGSFSFTQTSCRAPAIPSFA